MAKHRHEEGKRKRNQNPNSKIIISYNNSTRREKHKTYFKMVCVGMYVCIYVRTYVSVAGHKNPSYSICSILFYFALTCLFAPIS